MPLKEKKLTAPGRSESLPSQGAAPHELQNLLVLQVLVVPHVRPRELGSFLPHVGPGYLRRAPRVKNRHFVVNFGQF